MTSFLDFEQSASRLRRQLRQAHLPELRLICACRFFAQFNSLGAPTLAVGETGAPTLASGNSGAPPFMVGKLEQTLESYLREFMPILTESARKSNPNEFLPEEKASFGHLVRLLRAMSPDTVRPDDLSAFVSLYECAVQPPQLSPDDGSSKQPVRIACLFVEYYPDLDLAPRGRILQLQVSATPISAKADSDDIVVRNPVAEPDDRFLAQARDSVISARNYLANKYGLPLKKKYRFDFKVESSGARFTGDSLGMAFAVGAVAAVSRIEVFRERLTVSPDAAFSGALAPDGTVRAIDGEALKLKINRAFHSGVRYLVIPREHITEAWTFLHELEKDSLGRKLELMGADTLESVLSDPRLVPTHRYSTPTHVARKAWHAKRSTWVEVPALVALAFVLYLILSGIDKNPAYVKLNADHTGIVVMNADSTSLWQVDYSVGKLSSDSVWYRVGNIDSDKENEVLIIPDSESPASDSVSAFIHVYDHDGKFLWKRCCVILNEYSGDTTLGQGYHSAQVDVVTVNGTPVIAAFVFRSMPARGHITIWSAGGDKQGWYINQGSTNLRLTSDYDCDGESDLFFECINNRAGNSLGVFVLKGLGSEGVSPPYKFPGIDYTGVMRGNQKKYILFPQTDVCSLLSGPYNGLYGLRQDTDSTFLVETVEFRLPESHGGLMYYLNRDFRVRSVKMEDHFLKRLHILMTEGRLPARPDSLYLAECLANVNYWTDSGWVTEGQLAVSKNISR